MMSRIPPIDPAVATGAARDALERARDQFGVVPKLIAAMATSPAALRGFLDLRAALASGCLPDRLRGQLALLVSEENGSRYCVSTHAARAAMSGIADGELAANQRARSEDPITEAALAFAAAVLASRGRVTDAEMARVREAGLSDGAITEIIAHVALNCFANFFCQVALPALDAPPIPLTTDEEY